MPVPKKKSGLYKDAPERPLEDFQYLFSYLKPEPTFSYEGSCSALLFEDGRLLFIQYHREKSFLYSHMRNLAKFLNAKLVTVEGTWTWTASHASDSNPTIKEG